MHSRRTLVEGHVIVYDEAPPSLNAGGTGSRKHWGAAHREKMKWEGIFGMLLLKAKVRRGLTRCVIDVTLEFKGPARRDEENYRSSVSKPFADALVKGGWLKDDTALEFELRSMTLSREWLKVSSPLVKSRMTVTIEAHYASA